MPLAALSPVRPPPNCFSPMWMMPLRKVPFVSTTALALNSMPMPVDTPTTLLPSVMIPVTISCQKSTLGLASNASLHSSANRMRSFCVLGLHMAGPLDLLSIRNWIIDLSEIIPDIPPKASISLTICPLATPPIAGLHDIWAIVFMFMVINNTFDPIFAAALAASHPAWPAPTTMISYSLNMMFLSVPRETFHGFPEYCSTWNSDYL